MTALPVLAVLAGIAILAAGAWWFGMEKPKRDRADSLVDEARAAFVKDDRATAQSKLDEVLAVLPSHTGAEELRAEMASTLLEAIERALGSADSALARKDMLAAREAYAQVLALRPDHPRASSGLAGLKDIVGGLEVKTSPAGAKVQFGGLDSGTSPCTLKALPLGRHRLTLTLEGYDPVTEDVALRNEAFVSMDQQLARQRGTIKIESAPPGMIFNLRMTKSVIGSADETKRVETGKTPMSLENLPTGDYEARIFRQGWPDAVQVVSLSPQSTQNVSHAFAEGSLAVESMPPGMKATLLKPDGSVFTEGRTPLAMSVPTGSGYIVKMTRPGWPDFETKALTINKTANPPVSHAFNEGILEVTSEPPGMTAQITNTEGVNVISGKTPLRSLALPSGKEYLVKVQREGWPDFTANVRSPEVKPLVTHVAFDSGDLAVESNLKGAVISLTPEGTRIAELSSEITLAEWRLSAPLLSPEVRTPLEQALSSLRSNLAAAESSSPVKPFRSLAPAILKDIPTGTYVCVVRRPGSPVWQDKITITKGSNTLKLDFLTVTARTEVDACMMFHEGQRLGRDGCFTPLDFPALPGSYRVTVRFPGLAEMEQELVVAKESGQSHLVDYPGATLTLTSEPTGAIVMHRGNNIGKTPLTFPAVSAGEFEYALQLAGYMQRDIKLQLKPKEKHQEKTVFSNKPEDNVPAEFLEKMRAPNGLDLLVPKDGKKLPGQINLKLDGEAVTVSFDLDHSWTNPNNIDYEDAGSGSATTTLAEISRRWRHIELSLGTYGHPTFLLEDVKVPLNGSVKRTMDAGQGRYLIGYGSRYKTFKTSDVVFEFSNSIIIRADLDHLPIVLGAFD